MQKKRSLSRIMVIAVLVGAWAFPLSVLSTEAYATTTVGEGEDENPEDANENNIDEGNGTSGEAGFELTQYTSSFRPQDCNFTSVGRNPFFVLEPNYQLVLSGEDEDGEPAQITVTVLNETRQVNGTETRVVEERETTNGELSEISRNFFAICRETNSVFYFGEEVDNYENGNIAGHEGVWIAGDGANKAGMIMPGTILLGARYYQEIAPSVAMDRAEIINMGEQIQTPSEVFTDTLTTRETSPLEADVSEQKYYAAGIGLIQEETLKLEQYGLIK
jgi:hypothetical protein